MASAQLAAQFGLQLVRRDGKWDKVNPTARPENGQRLAGYVGKPESEIAPRKSLLFTLPCRFLENQLVASSRLKNRWPQRLCRIRTRTW